MMLLLLLWLRTFNMSHSLENKVVSVWLRVGHEERSKSLRGTPAHSHVPSTAVHAGATCAVKRHQGSVQRRMSCRPTYAPVAVAVDSAEPYRRYMCPRVLQVLSAVR